MLPKPLVSSNLLIELNLVELYQFNNNIYQCINNVPPVSALLCLLHVGR